MSSTTSPVTEASGGAREAEPPARPGAALRARLSKFGVVWFLVLLVGLAELMYPGFAQGGNLVDVLSQNAPIGLIAVGMTFAMISGGFDLSVGAIVALSTVVFAQTTLSLGMWPALGVTLLLGLGLGLVNGLVVTKLRINAFIATLATASIYSGTAYLLSHSEPIIVDQPGFSQLGQGSVAGLPISVWLTGSACIIGGLVLAGTVFGHCVYAVGGGREAARLAGIRVDRVQIVSYLIVGAASALAGIVLASRLGVGQADLGVDPTLDTITVVVIGGTSLFGGEGAMWRTAVGLLLLGVITNVADSKGWSGSLEDIIKGCVLLGAVGLDQFVRRVRDRRGGPA